MFKELRNLVVNSVMLLRIGWWFDFEQGVSLKFVPTASYYRWENWGLERINDSALHFTICPEHLGCMEECTHCDTVDAQWTLNPKDTVSSSSTCSFKLLLLAQTTDSSLSSCKWSQQCMWEYWVNCRAPSPYTLFSQIFQDTAFQILWLQSQTGYAWEKIMESVIKLFWKQAVFCLSGNIEGS